MIEAQHLTRRYGDYVAVRDVSFAVGEGEILGILGPNGAGKTTTLRMITGFLPPSEGRVLLAGRDLAADAAAARSELGYLPEQVALYGDMRVEEYLRYRTRLYGLPAAKARAAIADVLERCLLADVGGQIIGTLSKGYRQRVGLAMSILHEPAVLILDEPTVGLDPKQIIAIRELIRDLGERHTIVLSTHILPEVELLCDRVVIIDRGRLVAEGSPDSLREQWLGKTTLHVTLAEPEPEAAAALAALPGADGVAALETPGRFRVDCGEGVDLRQSVFRLAVEQGWVLVELAESKASLEDIFVRLTTLDAAEEDGAPAGAAVPAALQEADVSEDDGEEGEPT